MWPDRRTTRAPHPHRRPSRESDLALTAWGPPLVTRRGNADESRHYTALISLTQRGDELRHFLVSFQPTEALHHFEAPAATQRTTIWPPRQRLTFRFTCRVRLI